MHYALHMHVVYGTIRYRCKSRQHAKIAIEGCLAFETNFVRDRDNLHVSLFKEMLSLYNATLDHILSKSETGVLLEPPAQSR